jgi:hypothetical protein
MADSSVNYDAVRKINISPTGLETAATNISGHAQSVADALHAIVAALDELEVNWAGATQQEADAFYARWAVVANALFGPKENPNEGVLNAMVNGIDSARFNYSKAEGDLRGLWTDFGNSLPDPNSPPEGDTPPSHETPADELDTNKTAITADYPPYNR